MGSIFGSDEETTTSTSSNRVVLPGYISGPLKDLIGRAEDLSLQDYPEYTDPRIADFTEQELRGYELANQLVGLAPSQVDDAGLISREVARRGLEGYSQAELDPYMNPYIENVLDVQRRRAFDNYDIASRDLRQRAGEAAAFGGSRFSLAERGLAEDFQQQLTEQEALGLSNAFDRGLAGAQQGTALAGQAAVDQANLAGAGQQARLTDIGALTSAGLAQRGQEQAGLDLDYEEFLRQQAFPYEQQNYLGNLLLGAGQLTAGSEGSTTTTQSGGDSGFLGKALGVASLVAAPFTGGSSLAMGGLGGFGGLTSSIGGFTNTVGGLGLSNALGLGGSLSPAALNLANQGSLFLNQGGVVKGYNEGGTLSNKINAFLQYLQSADVGVKEGTEESYEMARPIYPNGPDQIEYRDLWERIENGEERIPIDRDDAGLSALRRSANGKAISANTSNNSGIDMVIRLAENAGVPPELAIGVFGAETSFGKNVKESEAGAIGPMQTMPDTLTDPGYGVTPARDNSYLEQKRVGIDYLGAMLETYGNVDDALIAYNWGPGNLEKWIDEGRKYEQLPTETKNYLKKVKQYSNSFNEGGPVTPFQEDLRKYLFNPASTAVDNLGMASLNTARGLSSIVDYFTTPVGEQSRESSLLDALKENMQLKLAADKLDRGQLPINLQKTMNQVGPLAEAGATDVRLNSQGRGLDVYNYNQLNLDPVAAHTQAVEKQRQELGTSDPRSKTLDTIEQLTGIKPSNTVSETESKKEESGINYPLVAFGSALLTSDGDFWKALGEGASAYAKTDLGIKQTKEESLRAKAKQDLDKLRTQLYGEQVRASVAKNTNPFDADLKRLKALKLAQEVARGGVDEKSVQNIFESLIESGEGVVVDGSVDLDATMQKAKQLAMTSSLINNMDEQDASQKIKDPLGLR